MATLETQYKNYRREYGGIDPMSYQEWLDWMGKRPLPKKPIEIKQLKKEHLDAIYKCAHVEDFDARTKGFEICNDEEFENAAKSCADITLEHLKGIIEYYAKTVPMGFFSTGENNEKTTEQLIELYFENLQPRKIIKVGKESITKSTK